MNATDARKQYLWWGVLADLNLAVAPVRTVTEREFGNECLAQGDAGMGIALALQTAAANNIYLPLDLVDAAVSVAGETPWAITSDVKTLTEKSRQRELIPA